MSRRGSGESRRSSATPENHSSDGTYVSPAHVDEKQPIEDDAILARQLTRAATLRAELYAEQDAENMRSAERVASHRHEHSLDSDDPNQRLVRVSNTSSFLLNQV